MRRILLILFAIIMVCDVIASEPGYLYKTTLVRAAPGKLLDLIELHKEMNSIYDANNDERPFWMRHSQGDQWDLLLLFPMNSYEDYYDADRIANIKRANSNNKGVRKKFRSCIAWQEDLFVYGPSLEAVRKAFASGSFYHVEIFQALPGKHVEFFKQREMENDYLRRLGRPQNLIFVQDQGAAWDLFTIGFYRDIKHYAESADIPPEREDNAAQAAGFEGADRIGTYLRTLISRHHDTLARAIR